MHALLENAEALKALARSYPEATEDFPWGESAFKVKNKVFVFMHVTPTAGAERVSMSFKLPTSRHQALSLPFASPTGYGLGKHGWVTAVFDHEAALPMPLITAWIDESYRAVAPKKLVAALDAR
ncbi:MAG: MmcQ/YjbR family DNA-binding protein [Myxococcales bacterium]|nr:MmcQ/YjbR family DNA-binding protein [Myxococcales bacterium]